MSNEIEARLGMDVYVTIGGDVAMRQDSIFDGEQTIFVHPDDVNKLIRLLKTEKEHAIFIRKEAAKEKKEDS